MMKWEQQSKEVHSLVCPVFQAGQAVCFKEISNTTTFWLEESMNQEAHNFVESIYSSARSLGADTTD